VYAVRVSLHGAVEPGAPDKLRRLNHNCQQSQRARLAIDFSTGCACISHASDVLGEYVVITQLYTCPETEGTHLLSSSRTLSVGFLAGLA
jgi:hypothetical protein